MMTTLTKVGLVPADATLNFDNFARPTTESVSGLTHSIPDSTASLWERVKYVAGCRGNYFQAIEKEMQSYKKGMDILHDQTTQRTEAERTNYSLASHHISQVSKQCKEVGEAFIHSSLDERLGHLKITSSWKKIAYKIAAFILSHFTNIHKATLTDLPDVRVPKDPKEKKAEETDRADVGAPQDLKAEREIGRFILDEHDYTVYATQRRNKEGELLCQTEVGIRETNHRLIFEYQYRHPSKTGSFISETSEDRSSKRGKPTQLHMAVEYQESSTDPAGADRLLDQKLTQIAVEIFKRQEDIPTLVATAHGDGAYVLASACFTIPLRGNGSANNRRFERRGGTLKIPIPNLRGKIANHRNKKGNKLYPPRSRDQGPENLEMLFYKYKLSDSKVGFTRDKLESWDDIINANPILTGKGPILPHY
ncbi:MAG: hypothetical protein K940chlam7_01575 [Chlamydiae bacterium]|nr:hypothetical protein [Chlamydiota bacterium]